MVGGRTRLWKTGRSSFPSLACSALLSRHAIQSFRLAFSDTSKVKTKIAELLPWLHLATEIYGQL